MRKTTKRGWIGTLLLCLLAGEVYAEGANWSHRSQLRARSSRPGLGILTRTGYHVTLHSGSESPLLEGCYLQVGGLANLSPASVHPGGYVEVVPVAPLLLQVRVQRYIWFGTFTALNDFEGERGVDWSPEALDEVDAEFGAGMRVEGLAQLRLKFGPVVALVNNHMLYLSADVDPGESFYDSDLDLLLAREDGLHIIRASAGAIVYGDLKAEHLLLAAHYERYATIETAVRRQILGLAALWRPEDDWWGKPKFVLLGGAFLQDPYKTGDPYVAGLIRIDLGDDE